MPTAPTPLSAPRPPRSDPARHLSRHTAATGCAPPMDHKSTNGTAGSGTLAQSVIIMSSLRPGCAST
jgi:hypothetical protein